MHAGRPSPLASTWRLAAVALLVLVVPGALERLGVVPDDEALRIPLAAALLAAGLFAAGLVAARRGAATLSRAGIALVACASAAALLPLAGAAPLVRPTVVSLGGFGPTAVALATAAAVVVGATTLADRAARARGLAALAVAGVVAAAWVVADRVAGRPAVGPFGRTGVAGPALAALAFAGYGAMAGSRLGSLPRVVVAALLLAGVVATGSRTGVAAAAAGAVVVALRTAAPRGRAVAGAVGVAGLVGAGLLVAGVGVPGFHRATVDVRLGLLRASGALVAERPLAGHGAFGFPGQVLRRRDLEEARISAGARPLAAHNDVAHAAVEGGVGAGLAVALLLGFGVVGAWRRAGARAPGAAGAAAAAPPDGTFVAVLGLVTTVAVAAMAENPLLSMTTAPVLGLVLGAVGARPRGHDARPTGRGRLAAAAGGLAAAALATCALDHALALADAGTPDALARGTFLGSEALRTRGYDAAAAPARDGRFGDARARYARLLAWDPGATEARLDVAETYRLDGRVDDAVATLADAARADPTRFDVPHRLGHLRLGRETPPSRRAAPADTVEVFKAYNAAAALAPDRFETQVAYARVFRRRGDLDAADRALEAAATTAARHGPGVPAELLLETFRLAEAVGAPLADVAKTLSIALTAGPRVAGELRAEADAALAAADDAARAAEAARARGNDAEGRRLDARATADRDAAAVRLAGLVRSVRGAPDAVRDEARRAAAARAGPRAVTLYRALLTDPYGVRDVDLVLEARAAAAGIDRERAEGWAVLARTMLGFQALGRGNAEAAVREFEAALTRDPADALAHFGRARALAALDRRDEAARALERAVTLDPAAYDAAFGSPDLTTLLPPRRP